ncbi:MAG: alpha-mannosidase [Cellulosilyticaceae bacterium]
MLNNKQIQSMLGKLRRYVSTLEPMIFEEVGVIETSLYETTQRLHQIPEGPYHELQSGDKWGQEGSYGWFKGELTVDETLAGEALYLYPQVGGYEGMLWVDGKVKGIYASKITVESHGNHYCDQITSQAVLGQKIELVVEMYAGHNVIGCMPFENSLKADFSFGFNKMAICRKNQEIADFVFDLRAINQVVQSLDEQSFRRAELIQTLTKIHQTVYYAPEDIDRETLMSRIRVASGFLKEELAKTNHGACGEAALIGHSHMDTAWLWEKEETIKKCARTYANQLNLMEQYPEYKFVQSSMYHLETLRIHYPELFERIKEKIKSGQYEVNGGVWVEADCNMPSGESLIRQFLWGQNYMKEHFGKQSRCFWLPDTFGYSAALPQIMKGCGVDYFLTTKLEWNDTNQFPYDTFYWQGIDGSKVLAHFNRIHAWPDPKTLNEFVMGNKSYEGVKQKTVTNKRLVAYGYGDGGGGPQFEMVEMARRCEDLEGVVKAKHVVVNDFMQELEDSVYAPNTYQGELYLELHRGTLTNQHQIKRNNRVAEILIHDSEYLTVREAIDQQEVASGESLKPYVNTLLVNQFHDIIPGTSIAPVHETSKKEMGALIEDVEQLVAQSIPATEDKHVYTVVNTFGGKRSDVITIPYVEGYCVAGGYKQQVATDLDGQAHYYVAGVEIPALGSITVNLEKGEVQVASAFDYEGDTLVTPFAKVVFDDKGYMKSFVDRRNGRELAGERYGLGTLLVAEDVPSAWDNWDIDADCEMKFEDCAKLISREVVADGEVLFKIRSTYALTQNSSVTQDMIFYADTPRVDFDTRINWQDHHRFLKAAFDTTIHTAHAKQEIQFGYATRETTRNTTLEQARFEVVNHKYTDLSETRYGIALLNDCKYGISLEGGMMQLSLHKGGCRPDETGDKGVHDCRYAFLPHEGGFGAETVILPAYCFNMKQRVKEGVGAKESLLGVDRPNIVIETIKPCEASQKAFIVRAYEAEGTYTTCHFGGAVAANRCEEVTLLEEALGETNLQGDITFKPFEIKTFKIYY